MMTIIQRNNKKWLQLGYPDLLGLLELLHQVSLRFRPLCLVIHHLEKRKKGYLTHVHACVHMCATEQDSTIIVNLLQHFPSWCLFHCILYLDFWCWRIYWTYSNVQKNELSEHFLQEIAINKFAHLHKKLSWNYTHYSLYQTNWMVCTKQHVQTTKKYSNFHLHLILTST